MRIRLECDGAVFELERHPMPERRFKVLCALVAAGVYAGMVAAVTALCGFLGLLVVVVGAVFVGVVNMD